MPDLGVVVQPQVITGIVVTPPPSLPLTLGLQGPTGPQGPQGIAGAGANATTETPAGTVDGSNATFTLSHLPDGRIFALMLNGLLQNPGALNDFTRSASAITFIVPPHTNDVIAAIYTY